MIPVSYPLINFRLCFTHQSSLAEHADYEEREYLRQLYLAALNSEHLPLNKTLCVNNQIWD
jgi:hypothetical protein